MQTILALLFLCLPMQSSSGIDPKQLPAEAATVEAFVPRGWTIEERIEGDLNRDAVADVALKLVEEMPSNADKDNPPERNRALLILFQTSDGKLRRAALANKVLLCTRCGGAFFGVMETPSKVTIKDGVLIVEQEYGSREVTRETFRFRHEAQSNRFPLIGVDVITADRATGETTNESTNLLTGVKLSAMTRMNEKTGKELPVSNRRQRVNKAPKYIEEISAPYSEQ
jgi:hypothetical protein